MSDPKPVLSEEQRLAAYQRAVDEATMEFVDDEMECHKRGLRAVERAVLEAVGGQDDLAPIEPSKLQELGGRLADLLDSDHFNNVEAGYLLPALQEVRALRARVAELEQVLHRFQHGEAIESDFICETAAQMLGVIEERDAARRELAEAREEIGRCNEREAAMEAEAGTWRRDHDRVEYLESLDGEVSLIRWTVRRHGEVQAIGWVLINDGPGTVSNDVQPTVRAAIDKHRAAKARGEG